MSKITPQAVKELRDKTGAGMADCKKALVESDGDMQTAIEYLRKKGAAAAAKRADRTASEGVVCTKTTDDFKTAAMVLVSCETDFVAMNKDFVEFANTVADAALANKPANAEELMKVSVDGTLIEDLHKDILAKFSEKIEIADLQIIESEGYIGTYIHGGAKLGVMVDMTADGLNDDAKALVKDIAMQVAAMNPRFSHNSEVDDVTMAKEKEIYTQNAIESGKPAEIAERIAEGKMNKFYEENCLVEMAFVKDPKKKVKDVVADIAKLAGKDINVKRFVRVAIGG